MTFEERVDFLMKSIESHDRQLGELTDRTDALAESIAAMREREDKLGVQTEFLAVALNKLTETTQLNFDRLTAAMLGLTEHVAHHQSRLQALEG